RSIRACTVDGPSSHSASSTAHSASGMFGRVTPMTVVPLDWLSIGIIDCLSRKARATLCLCRPSAGARMGPRSGEAPGVGAAAGRGLRRRVGMLDEAGACYQFTGGFAGNLHGSRWPLHDLDVDVARADLPRLAELLRPYTTRPLGPYADDEFELHLLRAELEGVGIDVSQAEEAYAGDPVGAGSGDAVRCPLPPATPGATAPTPAVYKVLDDGR